MKKTICVITSTRAEYGLLRNVIKNIEIEPLLDCKLVATGSHLVSEFGNTIEEIESDNMLIDARIEIQMAGDSPDSVCKTMGMAMISFSEYFKRTKPDMIVILGDRYEMCAIACAATNYKIPIAHLYGGETTEGAVDEAFRHAITKMSYLHFTSTEEYRKRVIQLGESPDRVFFVGSTGVENIKNMKFLAKKEVTEALGINLRDTYAIGTYHPETLNDDSIKMIYNLLDACVYFSDIDFLFTKANADAEGGRINKIIEEYSNKFDNIYLVASLGYKRYLSLLRYAHFAIGNSSSGIVEVPCFGIPTINIGSRQKGRIHADSIINVSNNEDSIVDAINIALTSDFSKTVNPYYGDKTSEKIVNIIKENVIDKFKINLKKKFYDIDFKQLI